MQGPCLLAEVPCIPLQAVLFQFGHSSCTDTVAAPNLTAMCAVKLQYPENVKSTVPRQDRTPAQLSIWGQRLCPSSYCVPYEINGTACMETPMHQCVGKHGPCTSHCMPCEPGLNPIFPHHTKILPTNPQQYSTCDTGNSLSYD